MMTKTLFLSLSLTLAATRAFADSDDGFDARMPSPANSFEIAVGFMQQGGDSGLGDLRDVAGPSGNGEVQLGYRLFVTIDDRDVSWTFGGGLLGRFDL